MNLRLRLSNLWRKVRIALGASPYLCVDCKYNNPRDCRHRVRPRATLCEDFRRR